MQPTQASSSKTVPILMVLIGVGLAAATVFSAKSAYELRAQLQQKEAELQQARQGSPSVVKTEELIQELQKAQARYRQLQAQYDQLKGEIAAEPVGSLLSAAALPSATSTNAGAPLERLRQQDPERYKQMMAEREKRRQQAETFFSDQLTRLDERLKTAQTTAESELLTQLSETLTRADGLRQKWEDLQQLPEEERRQQSQQLAGESWQTYQTLTELRGRDRQLQLNQLAAQIGYKNPKDTASFIDSIQRIYTETDTSRNRFMNMGGGGRRR